MALAGKGWRAALEADPHLLAGLATHEGRLYSYPVGEAQGIESRAARLALSA